jgi:hypothetical protein
VANGDHGRLVRDMPLLPVPSPLVNPVAYQRSLCAAAQRSHKPRIVKICLNGITLPRVAYIT